MMVRVQKNYPTSEVTDISAPENPLNDKTYTIADMVRDIFYDSFIDGIAKVNDILKQNTQGGEQN